VHTGVWVCGQFDSNFTFTGSDGSKSSNSNK
jgi:hypothetical protein